MENRKIRAAAVAGLFYPDDSSALRQQVDQLLSGALAVQAAGKAKAIIAPHAGYLYSGMTAARAYASAAGLRGTVQRIVIAGPCHRVALRGIALSSASAFHTPLGDVEIDEDCNARLRQLEGVCIHDAAHELEHSIEVHLPFLQQLFGDFRCVPLVVGAADGATVAQVLASAWGGAETLILVSSDLSHYLSDAMAKQVDTETAEQILALDGPLEFEQACGAIPINGLLHLARQYDLRPRLLDLRNSSAASDDRHRVVGYGAFAFAEPVPHAG